MPWLIQMLGCAGTILLFALAVWIGFWLLLVLAVFSLFYALWRYLVKKGIANPRPGMPPDSVVIEEETRTTTIIEGEFQRLEEKDR